MADKFVSNHFVWISCLMLIAVVGATPPGIANHPSHSRCMIKKYKHCYNLEHVCPKFCPNECTVECASCKPICSPGSAIPPPPPPDSESLPAKQESPPPHFQPPLESPSPPASHIPTPSTPTPTPSTPTPTPPTPMPSTPTPSTPTTPSKPTPTESPTTSSSPPTQPPSSPSPSPPSNTPSQPSTSTASTTPSSPPPPTTTPISTPPHTSPVSWSPPQVPKKVKCKNNNYPRCYTMEHTCPSSCPGGCEVDCVSCKPVCKCDFPGAVCQDPRFIGGDGITFYFHGNKDQDFCLVSDPYLHINAHFIGRRNQNMKRDFTWVQSIGILFDNHKLSIAAQKTATWDDAIDHLALAIDGEPIFLQDSEGATWQSKFTPKASITRAADTNSITTEVEGMFTITATVVPITEQESLVHNYGITKDDCFAHLDLGFKFLSLSDEVDGILGQSYRSDYVSGVKLGVAMPVMGGERKFATSSLFSADCSVARFKGEAFSSPLTLDLPSLSCVSRMDGKGVVCKR